MADKRFIYSFAGAAALSLALVGDREDHERERGE